MSHLQESHSTGGGSFVVNPPSQDILSNIGGFRKTGKFCDMTLSVGSVTFSVHKAVLAGLSPYFEALFSGGFAESNEPCVKIRTIDTNSMDLVLKFAYGEAFEIVHSNAHKLMHAANFFQIPKLFEECATFIESNLNTRNCLGVYDLVKIYSHIDLASKARNFALKNFNAVSREAEFLELSTEDLILLISDDNLYIPRETDEVQVFSAVIRWLRHREGERSADLYMILSHVRLAHIPVQILYDRMESLHAVRNSPSCMRLLERAIRYQTIGNRKLELQSPISKRRRMWSKVEVMIVCAENVTTHRTTAISVADDGRVLGEFGLPSTEIEFMCVSSSQSTAMCVQDKSIYIVAPHGERISTIPVNRSDFGITELDDFIYIIGGKGDFAPCKSLSKYNRNNGSRWLHMSFVPLVLYRPAVVTLRGFIYLLGGLNLERAPTVLVFRYDPQSNVWRRLCPLPSKMGEIKACAVNDLIYACEFFADISSTVNYENSRNVYVYDPNTNEWSSCAKLHNAFVYGPIPLNGNLFVLTEKRDKGRVLERYNILTKTWKELASFLNHQPYLIAGPLLIDRPLTECGPDDPLNFVRLCA